MNEQTSAKGGATMNRERWIAGLVGAGIATMLSLVVSGVIGAFVSWASYSSGRNDGYAHGWNASNAEWRKTR